MNSKSFKLVLFSLLLISLLSCSKDKGNDNLSKINSANKEANDIINSDLHIKNVGNFHNEAIVYYYNNISKLKSTSDSICSSDVVDVLSGYFAEKGFKQDSIKLTSNNLKNFLKPSLLKSTDSLEKILDPSNFVTQMENQDNHSDLFLWEVYDILDLIAQEVEQSIIDERIESFKTIQFTTKEDIVAQYVFVNTYSSSSDFWTNTSNGNTLKKGKLSPSSWVIINDGIGGILGLPLGGIGSIFFSTFFSVWTNEEVKVKTPSPSPVPKTPTKIIPPKSNDPRVIR